MAVLPQARWQRAAFWFACASLATFLISLAFTVWAIYYSGSDVLDGVGTLSQPGQYSYATTKNINSGVHVIINVLSTVLLAGSNYCMQCLMAPTRGQVDAAHRQHRWLDIGVPSPRNFGAVSWRNRVLWLLLSLSSVPLHLLFNSAIFTSASSNDYSVGVVNEAFFTEENRTALPEYFRWDIFDDMYQLTVEGRLDQLDPAACLDAYAVDFQSTRGDLLLVRHGFDLPQEFDAANEQLGFVDDAFFHLLGCGTWQAYQWMCNQESVDTTYCKGQCQDQIAQYRQDPASAWTPYGQPVKECYSIPTGEHSRLMFSAVICWIVTALTLVKALLMLTVAFALGADHQPLLTLGDAVASFLEFPDETTTGMCLASKHDITKANGRWSPPPSSARLFAFHRQRKFAAVSLRRWIVCIGLYVAALAAVLGLLGYGLKNISGAKDASALMSLGLGSLNAKTVIQTGMTARAYAWPNVLGNIVLANSPQLVMSIIYFTYNGLLTSISLATEWDGFARHRKGLRVAALPKTGHRRGTYFLQLPYRYSVPLLVFSAGLHWLISQTLFLAIFAVYLPQASDLDPEARWGNDWQDYNTCAWSPAGVVAVLVAGLAMLVFLVASALRTFQSGSMPVAASCSAAISAACHAVPYEELAWTEPLRWGVTGEAAGVGHCAFSAREVGEPQSGSSYR